MPYHSRNLPLARALIRELSIAASPQRRRLVSELMTDIFGSISELVRRAQDRGEVRADVDALEAARTVFAVYYQLLQTFLGEYVSERRFRAQLRSSLALLMEGLARTPPR